MILGTHLTVLLSCLLILTGGAIRQAVCLFIGTDRHRVPELLRVDDASSGRTRVPERSLSDQANNVHHSSNVGLLFLREYMKMIQTK